MHIELNLSFKKIGVFMNLGKMGLGSWKLGDRPDKNVREIESLRIGIEAGIRLIDTAEMYGEGRSELLVGQAIKPYKRKDLFLVSKVYPFNAGDKIYRSIENSLERLGTDYLDLYLLHWRGNIPLEETVYHMEKLVDQGLIKYWGVSNFDTEDMKELLAIDQGKNCKVNQVLYNLASRGIEYSLLPYLKENGVEVMGYCPIYPDQKSYASLSDNRVLKKIAGKHGLSIPQLLLAFIMYRKDIIPIPRTSNPLHSRDNAKILSWKLPREDYEILSREFPAPDYKTQLHIV